MKKRAVELKGGKCERCGYDKCLDALEFHHINPEEKEIKLGNKGNRKFEKYLAETKSVYFYALIVIKKNIGD